MKRVKLLDLSENVQAVILKDKSEEYNHSIKINFYAEHDEMFISISLELEYEELDVRERKFEEEITNEFMIRMFNKAIQTTPLEEELTIKTPLENGRP